MQRSVRKGGSLTLPLTCHASALGSPIPIAIGIPPRKALLIDVVKSLVLPVVRPNKAVVQCVRGRSAHGCVVHSVVPSGSPALQAGPLRVLILPGRPGGMGRDAISRTGSIDGAILHPKSRL